MVLFFCFVLNVTSVVYFLKFAKKLHILESMVYWMLGSYFFQNFSALCYMNFKTLVIPEKLSYELSHVLNRIVLFPLLMVAFLHLFVFFKSRVKKLLLTISFLLLFVALEWLADLSGILNHVHWRLWWSFAFWLATLLLLIGCMKLFRKILYHGGFKS